ncbi:MAG: 3D-(3,5/4)-trihydroxycyclohexane-1,2-dione acylhydrolase (decyclizing) [Candidatus Dormibacteraeota bacterium]|nr:3D-(3,5/4)-trihydroxycyclohexane-1,2-dione acylhydrolase (decyclizing) [Candidatus Dormibacteraeota bacterium]
MSVAISSRTRLTVGQAIVRYLTAQSSERDGQVRRLIPAMAGVFGHGNVGGLGEALYLAADTMPYLQARNEQAMVHEAVGFARANLRLATLACTASIGPGSTNMVTGAATATINRIPVLLLPADTYATRRQGIVMQQLEHPTEADTSVNDCLRPVSRFFDRIMRPEQLLTALPEAMRVLTSPLETGAATICLPQDLLSEAYDYPSRFFEARSWHVARPLPEPSIVEEALALIRASSRPVVIAGGGVVYSDASDALMEFARTFQTPVVETFAGKGAMQVDEWFTLGGVGTHGTPAAAETVRQADLVISVGTRLIDVVTGSQSIFQNPNVRFLAINVDGRDAAKQGALALVADAREGLSALIAAARKLPEVSRDEYRREVVELKERWVKGRTAAVRQVDGERMSQAQLIAALNRFAGPSSVVVAAAGTPPGDILQIWDATAGRRCHLEYGTSCMGYEIPAGLGVKMASPQTDVFVLIGDGTYLMNPTELASAVQEGIKITVIVSDNHGFQSVHRVQRARTGISFGNEFRMRDPATKRLEGSFLPVDIAANAASLGTRAFRVETEEQLVEALQAARAETRTCVIVAETELYRRVPDSTVWWDIAPAEVSTDPATQKARADYEQRRDDVQRYLG